MLRHELRRRTMTDTTVMAGIPAPTLRVIGVGVARPEGELGPGGQLLLRVQYTRPDVVGPVVLDFLGRHEAASAPAADG
jgi:hypothetical protein